jgi:hypothetical protein
MGNPFLVQSGCAPLNVQFTNMIPGAISWDWDFGDGTGSTQQFPSHMYSVPGIYNVSVTVQDTIGIVQTITMDSIVRVSGPEAGFSPYQWMLGGNEVLFKIPLLAKRNEICGLDTVHFFEVCKTMRPLGLWR